MWSRIDQTLFWNIFSVVLLIHKQCELNFAFLIWLKMIVARFSLIPVINLIPKVLVLLNPKLGLSVFKVVCMSGDFVHNWHRGYWHTDLFCCSVVVRILRRCGPWLLRCCLLRRQFDLVVGLVHLLVVYVVAACVLKPVEVLRYLGVNLCWWLT